MKLSSQSRQMGSTEPVVVLGGSWRALLIAYRFVMEGVPVSVFSPKKKHAERSLPVYLGNGETKGRANLTFGYQLTEFLWQFSERNYEDAVAIAATLGVDAPKGELRWSNQGELFALALDYEMLFDKLLAKLRASGVTIERFDSLKISAEEGLSQHLTWRCSGKTHEQKSSLIVCAEENLAHQLFGFMSDKLVVATLSSFVFSKHTVPECVFALFNDGVDFAIPRGTEVELGSFRNLYSDGGVGVHDTPDPRTLEGVRNFFGGLGWIDMMEPTASYLSVEAISCDGLPVIGALPDIPGAYVLAGFGGRSQNYFFEASRVLVEALVAKGDSTPLASFSTKRFV